MSRVEAGIIIFSIIFIIVFLVDYFFIKRKYWKKLTKGNKKKKLNELTEIIYLVGKFKLDKNKLPIKNLLMIISSINAFIIAIVSVIVLALNINIILKFLIGFVLLIALIYAMYEILGKYLERKEKENGE